MIPLGMLSVVNGTADGLVDDHTAIAAADAVGDVMFYKTGSYLVGSNLTIANPTNWRKGAILKLAAGVELTLTHMPNAGRQQIFDVSAGGGCKVIFPNLEDVKPQWLGAVVNDTTAPARAANDLTFAAIQDGIPLHSVESGGHSAVLDLGSGTYYMGGTLNIQRPLLFRGQGGTARWWNTRFAFPAGSPGVVFHGSQTSADGGTAEWSTVEHVSFFAEGKTTADMHGIQCHTRMQFLFCGSSGWTGDGLHIAAGTGRGPTGQDTNANCGMILGGRFDLNNGHGIFFRGSDANQWTVINPDVSSNGLFGIWDRSQLGCMFFGAHSANNGTGSGPTPAQVFHLDNRYELVFWDTITGAPVADPGTTEPGTNAAVWRLKGPGVIHAVYPQWVNGGTYLPGGAFAATTAATVSSWYGCYTEGSQPPVHLTHPAHWHGGVIGAGFTPESTGHRDHAGISQAKEFQNSADATQKTSFYAGGIRTDTRSVMGWRTSTDPGTAQWRLKYGISAHLLPGWWTLLLASGGDAATHRGLAFPGEQAATVGGALVDSAERGVIGFPDAGQFWQINNGVLCKRSIGTAAPTTGRARVGDVCFNRTPTILKNISHWVCITAHATTGGVWLAHGTGRGTTAQRPVLVANDACYLYYDTTLDKLIQWDGVAWDV